MDTDTITSLIFGLSIGNTSLILGIQHKLQNLDNKIDHLAHKLDTYIKDVPSPYSYGDADQEE